MATREEDTKWETKKKTLDRWDKTKPREAGSYELGKAAGPGSQKLESIDRGGKNSYRVMKPHEH